MIMVSLSPFSSEWAAQPVAGWKERRPRSTGVESSSLPKRRHPEVRDPFRGRQRSDEDGYFRDRDPSRKFNVHNEPSGRCFQIHDKGTATSQHGIQIFMENPWENRVVESTLLVLDQ